MEQLFESLVDRLRPVLDLKRIKTIFGAKRRPFRHHGHKAPRLEAVVGTPTYNLTIFKLHFGSLTLKVYSKGERTLRFEVIVHNTKHLPVKRSLDHFAGLIAYLRPILDRFLNTRRPSMRRLSVTTCLTVYPPAHNSVKPPLQAFIWTNPECALYFKRPGFSTNPKRLCGFRFGGQSP